MVLLEVADADQESVRAGAAGQARGFRVDEGRPLQVEVGERVVAGEAGQRLGRLVQQRGERPSAVRMVQREARVDEEERAVVGLDHLARHPLLDTAATARGLWARLEMTDTTQDAEPTESFVEVHASLPVEEVEERPRVAPLPKTQIPSAELFAGNAARTG